MHRARVISWLCFALFLAHFARVQAGLWLWSGPAGGPHQTERALLIVLATAATLTSLLGELPVQNLAMAALGIASLAWAGESLGGLVALPPGSPASGQPPGGVWPASVPWTLPALWVVVLLNSRGTARLILRPWRSNSYYGLWLMGCSVVFAAWFIVVPEVWVNGDASPWGWDPLRSGMEEHSSRWRLPLGRAVLALGVLFCAAPWLIRKQPGDPPARFQPLALWFLLHLGLASRAALSHLWVVAGLIVLESVGLGIWAAGPDLLRSARHAPHIQRFQKRSPGHCLPRPARNERGEGRGLVPPKLPSEGG